MTADRTPSQTSRRLEAKAAIGALSTAVVVSFDNRWLGLLSNSNVKLVLRKRVPRSVSPDSMYLYINSPTSSLLGRARIKAVLSISQTEALRRKDELELSADEIKLYFQDSADMGAYELGSIEVAPKRLSLEWLRRNLMFNPPQSFFFLAPAAQRFIDEHAGF